MGGDAVIWWYGDLVMRLFGELVIWIFGGAIVRKDCREREEKGFYVQKR